MEPWGWDAFTHTSPVSVAVGGSWDLQWGPDHVPHHHGGADHLAYLEEPFHEAIHRLEERIRGYPRRVQGKLALMAALGRQPGTVRGYDAHPMPASVVIVGSVNVDLVVRVPTLPRPGETVVGGTFGRTLGGKGANQAAAAAKLGARVWLVGLTGDDDFGREAREDLEARGVDVSTLGKSPSPTGLAAIMVDDSGENLIAVASGANHDLTGDMVAERLAEVSAEDAVLLANLEVPDDAVGAAATAAAQRGWRFVLNPAPARPLPPGLLARCDILTPNEREAEALGSVENVLARGARAVVLTRGANGADVFRPGAGPRHQETLPVEVVDTTGAGDAFNGALAWSLAEGRDLGEAVRLAVAAGALACRALGARAGLPDRGELESAIAAWASAG